MSDKLVEIRKIVAHGIRDYCAEIEVKSRGDTTPDPMWHANDYADRIITKLTAAGYRIVGPEDDVVERMARALLVERYGQDTGWQAYAEAMPAALLAATREPTETEEEREMRETAQRFDDNLETFLDASEKAGVMPPSGEPGHE